MMSLIAMILLGLFMVVMGVVTSDTTSTQVSIKWRQLLRRSEESLISNDSKLRSGNNFVQIRVSDSKRSCSNQPIVASSPGYPSLFCLTYSSSSAASRHLSLIRWWVLNNVLAVNRREGSANVYVANVHNCYVGACRILSYHSHNTRHLTTFICMLS